MSIATEITALNTNLTAAKNAVTAKGGTVGDTGLAGLATEISSIPSGGGGGSSEPTVPASPDGVYVELKAYNIALKIDSYENIDTSTTVVSFTRVGQDPFDLIGTNDPDFMLNSVFFESPNTGMPYNLLLRWNYSNQEFQLIFRDSSDQENVVVSFQEFDLEMYGIVLSDTNFMYYGSDYDLAYILITQAPEYSAPTTVYIDNSTDFTNFMAPDQVSWDSSDIGSGFGGVMRTQSDELVQKQFAVSINFGSLASSLTSIGNGFYQNNYFLQSLYNLPSSVTTIGDYFLYNCLNFNSYFKIPSGCTTIGNYFLANCSSYNQPLAIPQGTAIGQNFLYNCTSFNSPLDISKVTQIGDNFLSGCTSFNQPIELNNAVSINTGFMTGCIKFDQDLLIPANVTFYNSGATYSFMSNCNEMVSKVRIEAPASAISTSNNMFSTTSSSAPLYTTGITFSGDAAIVQAWKQKLPNRTSAPFRKVLADMDVPQNSLVLNDGTTLSLTAADVDNLRFSNSSASTSIGGVTVGVRDIYGVDISGLGVTTMPPSFLAYSSVQKLKLNDNITVISQYFLAQCDRFNQDITLPSTITQIGGSPGTLSEVIQLLYRCSNMTSTVYCECSPSVLIPSTSSFDNADSVFSTSISTDKMYVDGIKLAGTYAQDWKTRLPDSSSNPYRKLILAS